MASQAAADQAAIARGTTLFKHSFDTSPTIAGAAPGRVNLIGEHVDYNDGFVFPLALERNTFLIGGPSPDSKCHAVAEAFPDEIATFTPGDNPVDADAPKWSAYLKGMTAVYERAGHKIIPFCAVVVSDVPLGGGLSSSAALEMATGVLIETLAGITVDPSERAKLGQACEHEYAGVPCGIMDQLISSRGEAGRALLIDCRSLNATPVPLDHPDAVIVIANSCVKHELSGSEYPTRRRQCADAANAMAKRYPDKGITHLRDCTIEMLESVKDDLDEETVMRARHCIMEDKRTLRAKQCLEEGDLTTVGKLMVQSHESLRDLYEVSTKEIDGLVEIALSVDGVFGSRITGGGFGGCSVSLVHRDAVDRLMHAFQERYPALSGGLQADVFATRAGSGARNVSSLIDA